MNEKAKEIWNSSWEASIHTTEYATKRIRSAKSAKLTPVRIDANDLFGYFQGSYGRYETWLDYCPCVDFQRSKLPCKHIYRLAMELGVINEPVSTDKNMIPVLEQEKIGLSETIDIVESLSEDAQQELLRIAYSTSNNNPFMSVAANQFTEELLKSCIISTDGTDIETRVLFGKKADIASFLDNNNIKYKKSSKKEELEKLCMSILSDATIKHFGVIRYYNVRISAIYSRRNIHFYLHRKYDAELICDEFCNVYEKPLLETRLPDDKVTDELIKRGYYPKQNN